MNASPLPKELRLVFILALLSSREKAAGPFDMPSTPFPKNYLEDLEMREMSSNDIHECWTSITEAMNGPRVHAALRKMEILPAKFCAKYEEASRGSLIESARLFAIEFIGQRDQRLDEREALAYSLIEIYGFPVYDVITGFLNAENYISMLEEDEAGLNEVDQSAVRTFSSLGEFFKHIVKRKHDGFEGNGVAGAKCEQPDCPFCN